MAAITLAPGTEYVLTVSCANRPGLLHAISSFLVDHDANVIENKQFDDRQADMFFMRVQFESASGSPLDAGALRKDFAEVAEPCGMTWNLTDAAQRQRVLIMVSKYGHCLNDLLFRASTGWLNIDIVAVVSNHPDLAPLADDYEIPFYHVPVDPADKAKAEAELLRLADEHRADLVVLARYMQILSDDLCRQLEGRAINIHHSMLPSFKGARPYFQAYERGVKLVGATAHYVTADLDEGPIIEQTVTPVNHSMTAGDFTAIGRDTECLALAHAVRWHTENRVLLDGKRTVVFR
ncbi:MULTISPECIES: formyltetrahydrofolate deformylase [Streptomyces]|uniref:Formyltetrahydrofolate deformylase n=1 Tax=Streptomyces dengpaensis TaxID=2049881 RepID=A0ABN5HTX9_9ACTN|nr:MULTISPECIES: formyltetrahydrofolate deformylase [Streptomyces]AVH54528.1 formyltetrahydrofolate deformylase [Streptomyces dengpaensis]PIB00254.1 formyltetrahydrofolate deformylase [Streptomyces sp. HG99]